MSGRTLGSTFGPAKRTNGPSGLIGPLAHLAGDLRLALDPVAFAREALGIIPDPWQEDALRWQGKRLLLNCSRQSGKSTTTAIRTSHSAIYFPGSTTLLVSPSLRQSSELFRKVTGMFDRLATPPILLEDNKLSCELANGSRIVSLPSSAATVRGFSAVDLLIEDEAGWVPDPLYTAIRPFLAVTEGRLILMSTPNGKRGHFYDAWENGGAVWKRIKIPASRCPRISAAFLAEERRALGDWKFQQEYGCQFSDVVGGLFSPEAIDAAFATGDDSFFPDFDALDDLDTLDDPDMTRPARRRRRGAVDTVGASTDDFAHLITGEDFAL